MVEVELRLLLLSELMLNVANGTRLKEKGEISLKEIVSHILQISTFNSFFLTSYNLSHCLV